MSRDWTKPLGPSEGPVIKQYIGGGMYKASPAVRVHEALNLDELGLNVFVQVVWEPGVSMVGWSIADGKFTDGTPKYAFPTTAGGQPVHESRTVVSQSGHVQVLDAMRSTQYHKDRVTAISSGETKSRQQRFIQDNWGPMKLGYTRGGGVRVDGTGQAKVTYTSGGNLEINGKDKRFEIGPDGREIDNRILDPQYHPDYEMAIFQWIYGRGFTPALTGTSPASGPDAETGANLLRIYLAQGGGSGKIEKLLAKKRAAVIRAYQKSHRDSWFTRLSKTPVFPG